MNSFNDQYYILVRPSGEEQIFITPTRQSSKRKYRYKKLAIGSEPLFFENGFKEEDNNQYDLTDIFVDTSSIIVNDKVKEYLSQFDINDMQIHPSVFIDDSDEWHDNYWFFGFTKALACLDLNNSLLKSEPELDDDEDEPTYVVKKFRLKDECLEKINLEQRLIFKIAHCSKSYLFIHKDIVQWFSDNNITGFRCINVSEFIEGMQQ